MGWDKFEKLIELLKRRISQIVLYRMKDPRIGFITITKVDLSRDFKECKVFYTVLGTEGEMTRTAYALNDAKGYVQREVAKTLRTRTMPKIEFAKDESFERMARVNDILDTIRRERQDDDDTGDGENE